MTTFLKILQQPCKQISFKAYHIQKFAKYSIFFQTLFNTVTYYIQRIIQCLILKLYMYFSKDTSLLIIPLE